MTNTFTRLFLACLLAGTLSLPTQVHGQNQQDKAIDKAQAAKRAQQQVKGRVLKVEQGKSKYRVKVLQKSGRVVSVDVDKKSGKVSPPPRKKEK